MISSTMLPMKMDSPTVQVSSRWDYFQRAIPMWRKNVVSRAMYPVCLVLAVLFLFWSLPLLSVISFAGVGYFYYQYQFTGEWLKSGNRKVILAK